MAYAGERDERLLIGHEICDLARPLGTRLCALLPRHRATRKLHLLERPLLRPGGVGRQLRVIQKRH